MLVLGLCLDLILAIYFIADLPPATKRNLFGLAEGVYGRNLAPKAAESKKTHLKSRTKPCPRNFRRKSEPNRQVEAAMTLSRRPLSSRNSGDCSLAPSTRTWPLHCKKKYFSPRDARRPANSRPTVANLNHYPSGEASSRPTVANLNHYPSGEANSRPTVANLNHYPSGEASSRPTGADPNHFEQNVEDAKLKGVDARPAKGAPETDHSLYFCTETTCGHCRAYGPVQLHPFMRSCDASAFYVEAEILPAESRRISAGGTSEPARLQCWMMHVERTAIAKAMSSSARAKLKPRPA